jgi:hypothetical protein
MVLDFLRDDVWTPAFAGVTTQKTFYEGINLISQLGMKVFGDFLSQGKIQMEYRFKKKKGLRGVE